MIEADWKNKQAKRDSHNCTPGCGLDLELNGPAAPEQPDKRQKTSNGDVPVICSHCKMVVHKRTNSKKCLKNPKMWQLQQQLRQLKFQPTQKEQLSVHPLLITWQELTAQQKLQKKRLLKNKRHMVCKKTTHNNNAQHHVFVVSFVSFCVVCFLGTG